MCRLADDKELKQHFVFAKASLEHPEVKDWVKAEGIRGIPHLSIYEGTGGLDLLRLLMHLPLRANGGAVERARQCCMCAQPFA
jgi:hypothetical protein